MIRELDLIKVSQWDICFSRRICREDLVLFADLELALSHWVWTFWFSSYLKHSLVLGFLYHLWLLRVPLSWFFVEAMPINWVFSGPYHAGCLVDLPKGVPLVIFGSLIYDVVATIATLLSGVHGGKWCSHHLLVLSHSQFGQSSLTLILDSDRFLLVDQVW